ncbi:MAG: CRISPR system precrRNA processing endoribonuclease RAMP protein Cas6 [Candidatus Micrarchaeia archaeon]
MLSKLRYTLRFESPALLPEWKGGTIRGALGSKLHEISCKRQNGVCRSCSFATICPYGYIFETKPPSIMSKLAKCNQVTKPYVIEPPLNTKREYRPGDTFSFEITLFGNGVKYARYIDEAVRSIDRIGKGREKGFGNVSLCMSEMFDPNSGGYVPLNLQALPSISPKRTKNFDYVSVNFVTPTMLVFDSALIQEISFSHLIRAAARKFSNIVYFHTDSEPKIDWKKLFEDVDRNSKTISSNFRRQDIKRWAGRLSEHQFFPAVVGEAEYDASNLEDKELVSLMLDFGTYSHIGKFSTFGAGAYTYALR